MEIVKKLGAAIWTSVFVHWRLTLLGIVLYAGDAVAQVLLGSKHVALHMVATVLSLLLVSARSTWFPGGKIPTPSGFARTRLLAVVSLALSIALPGVAYGDGIFAADRRVTTAVATTTDAGTSTTTTTTTEVADTLGSYVSIFGTDDFWIGPAATLALVRVSGSGTITGSACPGVGIDLTYNKNGGTKQVSFGLYANLVTGDSQSLAVSGVLRFLGGYAAIGGGVSLIGDNNVFSSASTDSYFFWVGPSSSF